MKIAVVGCGVVGAAIAYELSQIPGLSVTVFERDLPAKQSTGAALGVLMGAISQKRKGNNLQMRLFGVSRYETWVPELENKTGRAIWFNRQGILRLCFEGEDLETWRSLAVARQQQGWQLELCDRAFLAQHCPQLSLERVIGAVYSPNDRQIDPTALTLALVAAATQNGVDFQFETTVTGANCQLEDCGQKRCDRIHTTHGSEEVDWLVIAAGLGSNPLTHNLQQPVDIRPVLGQAVRIQLPEPLGNADFQPVITGEDVHLVPLGNHQYWVGATVEFPDAEQLSSIEPNPKLLDQVMQQAIAQCPAVAKATIVDQWFGLRPRPEGRPAPIIEPLPGFANVILATGHYRNGVLLAPATAAKVRDAIALSST